MACEVAPLPAAGAAANNSSGSASAAFSPLTLFECTITNAQMLIESMADRELLQALKIAGGLHTHIVGVMEPRYDRACTRSDAHATCLMAAAAVAAATATSSAASSSTSVAAAASAASSTDANGAGLAMKKSEDAGVGSGDFSLLGVKEEQLLAEEDSMDDCLILEEDDASFGSAFAAASAAAGSGGGGSGGPLSGRKRPRQDVSGPGCGVSSVGGGAAGPGQPDQQVIECRGALRQSYKELKGSGPHLFNFALSFTDSTNQRVAEQVISHAQRQLPHVHLPHDTWWNELYAFAEDLGAVAIRMREKFATEKRRQRNRQRKLTRRQKSFELLATTLSTDEFDKYRVLLSRDYTSSDEETSEDGGALRVRSLPWESAAMRTMKRQLDEAYLENCATQKQAEQLRRTVRDLGCVSGRTPPVDCPNWALADEFKP